MLVFRVMREARRSFSSMPTTGHVTRTVTLTLQMGDAQRSEYLRRIYPASMFAEHDVIPRPLSRIEIENQQRLQAQLANLSPKARELIEQRLTHKHKPLRHFNFTAHKQKQPVAA